MEPERQISVREKIFCVFLLISVCVINIYFVYKHVCWRDEANTWLMARDLSVASLFDYTSYEGHPCLWYFAQMPFAKAGFPYVTLKLLSFFFVTASAVVIMFYTRLPLWMRSLIVLSPMCIAAFVTPARNYCMCAVFITALGSMYRKRGEQPVLYGALLALLLQTHIIVGGMVVICGLCFGVESLIKLARKEVPKEKIWRLVLGIVLPVFSGLFLLWEFRDTGHALGTVGLDGGQGKSPMLFFNEFWKGMVYLVGRYCALPVIIMVLVLMFYLCRKSRETWVPTIIFIVAIGWQVGMGAYIYELSYQYITWLYIFLWYLVTCCGSLPELELTHLMEPGGNKDRAVLLALFSFLVILGMWGGTMGKLARDHLKKPYSASRGAALVLDQLPDDAIVFENVEDFCCAVVPYLKKQTVYNPFTKTEASFFNRNPDHLQHPSLKEFKNICREMFPEEKGIYIIWSTNWSKLDCYIDVTEAEADSMELIWSSQEEYGGETISGEDFDIRYMTLQ